MQLQTSHLKVPKVSESFGSFSASVWLKPKKGLPKILLQGKSYMTFVTFILPEILKEIEVKNDNQKPAIESSVTESGSNNRIMDDTGSNTGGPDMETLMIGFQKMESEVIKLRDNLVGIVDESLKHMNMEKFEKKIDKLEKIALENKSELRNLNNKIDEVIAHQQKVKPVDVDALEDFITSSRTTFTKLENITTIHTDNGAAAVTEIKQDNIINEVLKEGKNISAKLDEVNRVTGNIKEDIRSDSLNLKELVVKVSNTVSGIAEQLQTYSEPSVTPKEQKTNDIEETNDRDDIG